MALVKKKKKLTAKKKDAYANAKKSKDLSSWLGTKKVANATATWTSDSEPSALRKAANAMAKKKPVAKKKKKKKTVPSFKKRM